MANAKRLRPLTRVAVTAVVLMMAVMADLFAFPDPTARAVDAKAIRVASSNLIIDHHYGWPVAILDRPERDYSSRAGAAAYCVADESMDAFRRFHAALYTHQPPETAASFPDNAALIDTARQLGAGDATADCINNGTYTEMVAGMAEATNVAHTPTVRINGHDYELSTPEALVATIKEIVGPVPGLDAPTTNSTRPS